MLTSLYVDNFKALNNFSIKLGPITTLIGSNASGKTTVLQAIDLIANFASTDLKTYIEKRHWQPYDLKSTNNPKFQMTFRIQGEFDVNGYNREIEWDFVLHPIKKDKSISVVSERVIDVGRNINLLSVTTDKIRVYNESIAKEEDYPFPFTLPASLLNNINEKKDYEKYPTLLELRKFFTESDSFELLSVDNMRRSSRGNAYSIGNRGEKLAAFIQGLPPQQRKSINMRLNRYINFFDSVDPKIKGAPGWIELEIAERFSNQNKPVTIKPSHVSDGTLRILALSACMEIQERSGMLLLDEIEDGINPGLAGKVILDLIDSVKVMKRQLIVTTHSTVMLDYFPPESIIYLWREQDGQVIGRSLFDEKIMKEYLDHMYPGEVWLNLGESEILKRLKAEL